MPEKNQEDNSTTEQTEETKPEQLDQEVVEGQNEETSTLDETQEQKTEESSEPTTKEAETDTDNSTTEQSAEALATDEVITTDVPEESNSQNNKVKSILIAVGVVIGLALVAALLYVFVFNKTLTANDALQKAFGDVASEEYVEMKQDFDAGFFSGVVTAMADYSDITNPKAKGSFEYSINFFGSQSVNEEFVAIKDQVLARTTSYESEEVPEEELDIELNVWKVVGENGAVTQSQYAVAEGAYDIATSLGPIPVGGFDSAALDLVKDTLREALSFSEDEVVEEDLDGEVVYKIPVEFDVDKLKELNKKLNEEYEAYIADPAQLDQENSYFAKATVYVTKKGEFKKLVVEEEGATVEMTLTPLDSAPEITLPEVDSSSES